MSNHFDNAHQREVRRQMETAIADGFMPASAAPSKRPEYNAGLGELAKVLPVCGMPSVGRAYNAGLGELAKALPAPKPAEPDFAALCNLKFEGDLPPAWDDWCIMAPAGEWFPEFVSLLRGSIGDYEPEFYESATVRSGGCFGDEFHYEKGPSALGLTLAMARDLELTGTAKPKPIPAEDRREDVNAKLANLANKKRKTPAAEPQHVAALQSPSEVLERAAEARCIVHSADVTALDKDIHYVFDHPHKVEAECDLTGGCVIRRSYHEWKLGHPDVDLEVVIASRPDGSKDLKLVYTRADLIAMLKAIKAFEEQAEKEPAAKAEAPKAPGRASTEDELVAAVRSALKQWRENQCGTQLSNGYQMYAAPSVPVGTEPPRKTQARVTWIILKHRDLSNRVVVGMRNLETGEMEFVSSDREIQEYARKAANPPPLWPAKARELQPVVVR